MMRGIPDELDRRQHRAHFHHEHHWILDHDPRVELAERIDDSSRQNRGIREGLLPNLSDRVHGPQKTFPAFISKCSRIGPRLKAGKNVSAPTIRIVETSRPLNSDPLTGSVPADAGTVFFLARLPAIAMIGMIMKKRPRSCAAAVVVLYHMVFPLIPAKADPLLPVEDT